MHLSTAERHAATLNFLAQVRDYIARWPSHPMNSDMIRRIEAHLDDPAHQLARQSSQMRSGASFTPTGLPVLSVTTEGDTATITAPPAGEGLPDDQLLLRLRAGEVIILKPAKT